MIADKKSPTAYWLIFQNDQLVVAKESATQLLTTDSITPDMHSALIRQHYLPEFQPYHIECAELPANYHLSNDYELITLRSALNALGEDWYQVLARSFSIINWDKNHQFCGKCGHSTALLANMFERQCMACGLIFYPRISPSIIVLIQKGDEILMARGAHFPPGIHALIAGFVSAGESIEDAVHREVKEEVNINIKNLRYFGSQAWPFPDTLMIAFLADYESGEIIVDPKEIETAGWYRHDNMPGRPHSISISSKLIDHFVAEQLRKPTT